jgi:hypothetical protein
MTVGKIEFQDPSSRPAQFNAIPNLTTCRDGIVAGPRLSESLPAECEVMDPVEQLCSMLAWSEDWDESYKRERLEKAIRFVMKESA